MAWSRFASDPARAPRVAVTNTKTTSSSATTGSYIDATDLTVTISPSTATTKIFVTAQIAVGTSDSTEMFVRVLRGSTSIGSGTYGDTIAIPSTTQGAILLIPFVYLDSPATTSATTYKVQFTRAGGAGTAYINRRAYSGTDYTASSTISVMEVRT